MHLPNTPPGKASFGQQRITTTQEPSHQKLSKKLNNPSSLSFFCGIADIRLNVDGSFL